MDGISSIESCEELAHINSPLSILAPFFSKLDFLTLGSFFVFFLDLLIFAFSWEDPELEDEVKIESSSVLSAQDNVDGICQSLFV